jgi:hypothetical protein
MMFMNAFLFQTFYIIEVVITRGWVGHLLWRVRTKNHEFQFH